MNQENISIVIIIIILICYCLCYSKNLTEGVNIKEGLEPVTIGVISGIGILVLFIFIYGFFTVYSRPTKKKEKNKTRWGDEENKYVNY